MTTTINGSSGINIDTSTGVGSIGTDTSAPVVIKTGGSERMRIDTSGQIGVGVVPSTKWSASYRVIELPSNAAIYQNPTGAPHLAHNLYFDGAANKYASSAPAARVQVHGVSGAVTLQAFASGTVDATATVSNSFQVNTTDCVMTGSNGGLGYGSGAGGTVTQATSKATNVTLNKPTGQITMNNAALAAGAAVSFVCFNSLVAATDCILAIISGASVADSNAYRLEVRSVGSGSIVFKLTNLSAVSLSESVQINFAIIKGATA